MAPKAPGFFLAIMAMIHSAPEVSFPIATANKWLRHTAFFRCGEIPLLQTSKPKECAPKVRETVVLDESKGRPNP